MNLSSTLVLGILGISLIFTIMPLANALTTPQFLFEFGNSGSGDGQTSNPNGIAFDSTDNVIIADQSNHRIQVFDSNGDFLFKFGDFCQLSSGNGCIDPDGSGPLEVGDGQFFAPSEVAVDSNDRIIVSDGGNLRIQVFDSNGDFLFKFGSNGFGDGQFHNRIWVSVDNLDRILVTDVAFNNSRVQVFDSNGIFLFKFGNGGAGDGQLGVPTNTAVDSSNNIIVADGNQVQIFDSSGNFITKFGSFCSMLSPQRNGCVDPDGSGPLQLGDGQFWDTQGVAVDSADNIYVADGNNYRIQIFDSNGNFLLKFGSFGTGPGRFAGQNDVGIDSSNRIFDVSSENGGRIKVYSEAVPADTTPPIITVPSTIIVETGSINGESVNYSVSAIDDVGIASGPTCTPESGSTFSLGTTTVSCTAEDAAGNVGTAQFNVNVRPQSITYSSDTTLSEDIVARVNIGASDITLDCDGHSIIGNGDGHGINMVRKSGVTIQNCTVTNHALAINVERSSENSFLDNIVIDNRKYGIFLHLASSDNLIQGNAVSGHGLWGINVESESNNNTVKENIVTDNTLNGIYLHKASSNNLIEKNTVTGQGDFGIFLAGASNDNIIRKNTLNDNEAAVALTGSSKNIVENNNANDNNLAGIQFSNNSNENIVAKNEINNSGKRGLLIVNSDDNVFEKNEVNGHILWGIELQSSDGNTVSKNTVNDNSIYGIYLHASSSGNVIEKNITHDNGVVGIRLQGSDNTTIDKNDTQGNGEDGMRIVGSDGTIITKNISQVNGLVGIFLDSSSNNELEKNETNENGRQGIRLDTNSNDNVLTKNKACDNGQVDLLMNSGTGNKFLKNEFCTTVGI